MRNKWDERFIDMTNLVSTWSSCKRRNVGAIIIKDKRVVATGYNGAPAGMTTCVQADKCLRDISHIEPGSNQEICNAIHAEQNAIVQAAKLGISIDGATLYCTHKPCSICAKMIVNSGIKEVVYSEDYPDEKTKDVFQNRVVCRQYRNIFDEAIENLEERQDIMSCLLNSVGLNGDEIVHYLQEIGFFSAPASTRYHLAYEGGLFDHSFNVAKNLVKFTKDNNLKWQKERSPMLIGLLHDLCKSDQYLKSGSSFTWNKSADGRHGIKSAEIARILVDDLTEEEFLCIEQHMSAFTDKAGWDAYNKAAHKYENVLWTHQADVYSTYITENDK